MPRQHQTRHSISRLPDLAAQLTGADQTRFRRIFRVTAVDATVRIPPAMDAWVRQHFGEPAGVETQRVVRVDNLVTGEGTLFNGLRGLRPLHASLRDVMEVEAALEEDVWERPREATPEDSFERLTSPHGLTGANVAKYDAAHGIIVFTEADPLAFTKESIAGHLALAERWFKRAQEADPQACYPFLMWNCLWRAGGSVVHGHFQVALARGRHYAHIERLRHDAEAYRRAHGADYFDDLVDVHKELGLAANKGKASVLAYLTPLKERETLLFAPSLSAVAEPLYAVLRAFRDAMGVQSFNMGVLMPPIAPVTEDWNDFPVMVRVLDRGALESRTSDIGGMELFAQNVVASDPFELAAALQATLEKG